jgi:hypothetical protein
MVFAKVGFRVLPPRCQLAACLNVCLTLTFRPQSSLAPTRQNRFHLLHAEMISEHRDPRRREVEVWQTLKERVRADNGSIVRYSSRVAAQMATDFARVLPS